jgi:hypothetical protein
MLKAKHTFVMVFESDELQQDDITPLQAKFKSIGIENIHLMLVPGNTNVKLFDLYTAHEDGEM